MFLNQPMILLLYKEAFLNSNEHDPALPSFVVSLLQEFEDVFPDEMPNGLPPIRGIEHQIDFIPLTPLDLMPLPLSARVNLDGKRKAELVTQIHEKALLNIKRRTKQYAKQANKGRHKLIFEPGDWVWLHLRKERFPEQRKSKLKPRGDGPSQILERINDNTYKLDLPGEFGVSATFNISDLSPFNAGDDLRTNPSQEEGNDENVVTGKGAWDEPYSDPILVPIDPVTRARAKKFKDALMGLIRATWSQTIAWRPIEGITRDDQPSKCVIQVVDVTE